MERNPPLRVGLLGLGTMGRQHLAGYARIPGVEVFTRESEAFERFGPEDRDALYAAMIEDPTLHALDLCLPTPLHARVTIAALLAGKHVLCEKPMALNSSDCDAMLQAAQGSGSILMIAHVLRFAAPYRLLAETVQSCRYGALEHLGLTRSSGYPRWAAWLGDPGQSGGGILDLLIHDFDQAIAIAGLPAQIAARQLASADSVHAALTYGPSAPTRSVAVTGGWYVGDRPFAMGFHARFAEAALIFRDNSLLLHRPRAQPTAVPLGAADMYTEQLRYFVQCCRRGQQPDLCPPAAAAQAVTLAIDVRTLSQQKTRLVRARAGRRSGLARDEK